MYMCIVSKYVINKIMNNRRRQMRRFLIYCSIMPMMLQIICNANICDRHAESQNLPRTVSISTFAVAQAEAPQALLVLVALQ